MLRYIEIKEEKMPSTFNLASMLTFNEGFRVQFFHQIW